MSFPNAFCRPANRRSGDPAEMEQSLSAMDQPRVAIFCPTFLKPEMLHVYRQVAGLRKVAPVVLTFKRENADQFPFEPIRFVHRSPFRWLRRIWNVQIRKIPQQAYRDEVELHGSPA